MRYYRLSYQEHSVDQRFCAAGPLVGSLRSEKDILAGGAITDWPDGVEVQITCRSGAQIDPFYFSPAGDLDFVTGKAAAIFQAAELRGLQLLKVRPTNSSPPLNDSTYLFHIVAVAAALDYKHSELSYYVGKSKRFAGMVTGVRRPVLDLAGIPLEVDIFRLATYTHTIYVTERFKQACVTGEIDVWDFRPAEIWQHGNEINVM